MAEPPRGADPLRRLAEAMGRNEDVPEPQFFMDPRSLSARNMLHSALNTSANWLDGTKDPSLIGPQEMVSPLGLAGMGMAMAPRGSIGAMGGGRPANAALDMSKEARLARAKEQGFDTGQTWYHGTQSEVPGFKGDTFFSSNPQVPNAFAMRYGQQDGGSVIPTYSRAQNTKRHSADDYTDDNLFRWIDEAKAQGYDSLAVDHKGGGRLFWSGEKAQPWTEFVAFDPATIRSTQAAFDPAKRDSTDLLASSPSASTPGLAANSTQQDDQGVMSILRRYGLAD